MQKLKIITKKRIKLSDPEITSHISVELKHPTVKQKIWKKIYRVNSYNDSIQKGIALDLGMKILAGGTSSLLYDELVNKKKLFSMVGGFYQGLAKDQGYVYFYAIPNDDIDEKKINQIIYEELKESIQEGLSLNKLNIEKKKYIYDSIYRLDGILKPSEIIGEALTVGLSLKEIENWNENLDQISLDMVKEEMINFLKNKNYVVGTLKN